jgi:hypothetical protein
MRRPVMYLAGLLLATGASLALAGPASAAPSHHVKCHHNHNLWWFDDDSDVPWYFHGGGDSYGSHNSFHGVSILSGNGGIL